MSNSDKIFNIAKILLVAGAATAGYFFVVAPVLDQFGMSLGGRRRARKISDFHGFDPTYYRYHMTTMSHDRAKVIADQAYESVGWVNDDEKALIGVIRSAGSKANLSLISHYFTVRHKQDLGAWYADYMDRRAESKAILSALKNLR